MNKVRVHHNNQSVEGVVLDDQIGCMSYEVKVDVGERGAKILHYGPVLIVHKDNIEYEVICHACGESVIPTPKERQVMRHQDHYVSGFSLSKKTNVCPKCGEKDI